MGSNFLTRRSAVKVLGGAGLSILGSSLVGCSQPQNNSQTTNVDSKKTEEDSSSPKVITLKSAIESDQETVWFRGIKKQDEISIKSTPLSIYILGKKAVKFYDQAQLEFEKEISYKDIASMSDDELVKRLEADYQQPSDSSYRLVLAVDKTGNNVAGEVLVYTKDKYGWDHSFYETRKEGLQVVSGTKMFGTVLKSDFVGFDADTCGFKIGGQGSSVYANYDSPYFDFDMPQQDRFCIHIPTGTGSNYSFELDSLDSGIEVQ